MKSYKLIALIGQGSFGSVYLVEDQTGQKFALKKIRVDPFQIDQALRQIQLMKSFQHPNLVKIHDYYLDQENGQLQIVMEYCEEGDLMKYFQKKKKFAPQEILQIFRQIFLAFNLMTVKLVIHRDLKPENILLGKGTVVKIGDFGCGKMLQKMEMSKVGSFSSDKGTYLYASPEQLKNQSYSFKCDVWSAGCIAYLLEYGTHPFQDQKAHNTLLNIIQRTQKKFIQLSPGMNPTVSKLISSCLIYQDRQRATWRQIWLSRIFAPKISEIKKFVDYLKTLSNIANWITKQFWKIRKQYHISKHSDEIFIYFLIKFQLTVLKMALKILKKSPNYQYLFEQHAFKVYEPMEEQFNEIKKAYLQHQKYFTNIKKTMQSKPSYVQIASREIKRVSCFSDLDKSIRAAQKILTQVIANPQKKDNKVWITLSYWINFQSWFSFEKDPHLQKIIGDYSGDIDKLMTIQIEKYKNGCLE